MNALIANVSSSVNWGDNATCTVKLVEDPENGIYINMPAVGSPVSLSLGSFYFGGIFQRWSYEESISGRTYDIIIESPSKYLEGIQVILSDFMGTQFMESNRYNPSAGPYFTNDIVNIWNVFGHRENYAQGGSYGESYVNSAGFPLDDALDLIELLSRGDGASPFGGRAVFGGYQYTVNLRELKNAVRGRGFRLQGPIQSLASIVQECCENAGLDYMVELRNGTQGATGSTTVIREGSITNPEIYIRTISRGYVPNIGVIQDFISSVEQSGTLVSRNVGQEWSAPITQKLAVGGRASRMLTQTAVTTIPVWGKQANNRWITGLGVATPFVYSNPTSIIQIPLSEFGGLLYTASLFEIRMATAGKSAWETFKGFETAFGVEKNGYNNPYTAPWVGVTEANSSIINQASLGLGLSSDFEPTSAAYAQKRISKAKEIESETIWNAVNKVASSYYGQVFLMKLNTYEPGGSVNNVRWIQEDIQAENIWDIVDSAWAPELPFDDLNFYDGEGRLKGGCVWPRDARFDFSGLGSEYAIEPGGRIGTWQGGPDKDIYWINNEPYVICRSGAKVLSYDALTTPDFGLSVLIWLFTGQWVDPSLYMTSGAQNVQVPIPPAVVPPYIWLIPQESNRYVWGPWWAWTGGYNIAGKSEVVFDEGLRPEVFGSSALMDEAGLATATTGLAATTVNETGSIELVGLPSAGIADQLVAGGPYINGISINVGVDSTSTSYEFQSWTPQFGKLSQNNIERIKRVRKGVIAFAQKNRAQITRRPFPARSFEKSEWISVVNQRQQQMRQSATMMHSFYSAIASSVQNSMPVPQDSYRDGSDQSSFGGGNISSPFPGGGD